MGTSQPRERLTQAATTLFYQQGVRRTTLADIAQAAAVPLGNVYYYFRTKDALIDAVTTRYADELRAAFERHEAAHQGDPRAALLAFLDGVRADCANLARYGCPYGSLCSELEKVASPGSAGARALLQLHIDWFARQLAALGDEAQAVARAEELYARLQGALIIASSLQEPAFLERQIQGLAAWIGQLA